MSSVSLLPVVKVVVSGTLWGPSLVQPESTPPGGNASLAPVLENRALQSVGKAREGVESLTMFPSSSKTPAFPISVTLANALLRNGIEIANVISPTMSSACTYRLETSNFVVFEIFVIVDNYFRYKSQKVGIRTFQNRAKNYKISIYPSVSMDCN